MRNGGYKVLNFNGYNFQNNHETPSSVHGLNDIYDRIESTNKQIMVSGLVIDGIEFDDMFANFMVVSSKYETTIFVGEGSIIIEIDANNKVYVALNV